MNQPLVNRIVVLAAVAVMVLGVWARLGGLFSIELWADEAMWASKLVEGSAGWIRPPGYMAVTNALLSIRNDEVVLRSLSLIPGLLQVPLLWLLLRQMVRPSLAVAGVFLLAINPVAVAMAKEFKPYALESFIHTAMLLLAFAYLARPRTVVVAVFALLCAASPPFAWTPVFLFPGAFLTIGLTALREKRKTDIVIAIVGVVATLAVLGAVFWARLKNADPHPEFWGKSYDVFFVGQGLVARLAWILDRTAGLGEWPLRLRFLFPMLAFAKGLSIVVTTIGAVAVVVRRRWWWVLLFHGTFAVYFIFNLAGQWPYGVFRTNVFLLTYLVPMFVVGVDALADLAVRVHQRLSIIVLVTTFGLLACAMPRVDQFTHKGSGTLTADAAMLEGARLLRATVGDAEPKVPVIVDGQGCSCLHYYRKHHDDVGPEIDAWFNAHTDTRCSKGRDAGYQKLLVKTLADESLGNFWVLVAKPSVGRHTEAELKKHCHHTLKHRLRGSTLFWCGRDDSPTPTLKLPTSPRYAP